MTHVTNGVHVPSWDSPWTDALWTRAAGKERWRGDVSALTANILELSDEDLWILLTREREDLVRYARERLFRKLARHGSLDEAERIARGVLHPDALTLGFARRFATYKRPTLLLRDPARLLRLLNNQQRPVQLVIAGKAHPHDEEGKHLIQQWAQFATRAEARAHVVFLDDYDMRLATELVQGVDVWINTPRRPWEASGTSGMKVLVNGGLNLSTLDGWWSEAFAPDYGWALGDRIEQPDDDAAGGGATLLAARRGDCPGILRARRRRPSAAMDRAECARAWPRSRPGSVACGCCRNTSGRRTCQVQHCPDGGQLKRPPSLGRSSSGLDISSSTGSTSGLAKSQKRVATGV